MTKWDFLGQSVGYVKCRHFFVTHCRIYRYVFHSNHFNIMAVWIDPYVSKIVA